MVSHPMDGIQLPLSTTSLPSTPSSTTHHAAHAIPIGASFKGTCEKLSLSLSICILDCGAWALGWEAEETGLHNHQRITRQDLITCRCCINPFTTNTVTAPRSIRILRTFVSIERWSSKNETTCSVAVHNETVLLLLLLLLLLVLLLLLLLLALGSCYFAHSPENFWWIFSSNSPGNFALKNGGDFWYFFAGLRLPRDKARKLLKNLGKFGAKFGVKFGEKFWKVRETFVLQLFWPKKLSHQVHRIALRRLGLFRVCEGTWDRYGWICCWRAHTHMQWVCQPSSLPTATELRSGCSPS